MSFAAEAIHLDGESGQPIRLTVTVDNTHQSLTGPGLHWPLNTIRELPDTAGGDLVILSRTENAVERLILKDSAIRAHLPCRRRSAPVANRPLLLKWAAAAMGSVALILFVLVPIMADQLANYIPPEGERALGQVTLNEIREALDDSGLEPVRFCTDPDGLTALRRIEARLSGEADLPVEITVHILDHEMVNAFALPGGHIVFFRGLIEQAGAPDELAAVFAHEMGHVASRDPTRHALRSAGSIGVLGLLFGDFAGGAVVLFLAERLIDAQYSQTAEAAADVFAHDLMRRAGLSPGALATIFERFAALDGDTRTFMQHFMSHPALGDRIERARRAVPAGLLPEPLMGDADWAALQTICSRTARN
ncbi:M48 family metallopeptidase [Sagittula salina]|uniref:M48 family metallopeptidase n=1 Tax=Sagittula salina TaxID=2820268 RepID=A0A940S1T7_9RHOB|nr:M48 family metallopeptidase [Sagittula salina]MBP0483441.1 M48 family metallopeptidase [Sagittula salina]